MNSAVIEVLSNSCVGPSPGTKIYFSLLSVCVDELLSTSKIITFFRQFDGKSNQILYQQEEYFSESLFLVSLLAANKIF